MFSGKTIIYNNLSPFCHSLSMLHRGASVGGGLHNFPRLFSHQHSLWLNSVFVSFIKCLNKGIKICIETNHDQTFSQHICSYRLISKVDGERRLPRYHQSDSSDMKSTVIEFQNFSSLCNTHSERFLNFWFEQNINITTMR